MHAGCTTKVHLSSSHALETKGASREAVERRGLPLDTLPRNPYPRERLHSPLGLQCDLSFYNHVRRASQRVCHRRLRINDLGLTDDVVMQCVLEHACAPGTRQVTGRCSVRPSDSGQSSN